MLTSKMLHAAIESFRVSAFFETVRLFPGPYSGSSFFIIQHTFWKSLLCQNRRSSCRNL